MSPLPCQARSLPSNAKRRCESLCSDGAGFTLQAPACARDPWLATSLNVEAVRLFLRLRSTSQLVIYRTTNSGYGTKSGHQVCTEETPLEPISLYGETKVQAESEVLASGNAITLRLATVFGISPRMRLDLLVNHFVYAAVTDG